MSRYSVDRIEGELAVLVDDEGRSHTIELSCLPSGTREGTVLQYTDQCYVLDIEEEESRRNKALSLQEKLRQRAQK